MNPQPGDGWTCQDSKVLAEEAFDMWRTLSGAGTVVTLRWCIEKTLEWWSIPRGDDEVRRVMRETRGLS